MVSFVCDNCQETLKKAKVQGHLNRCHGPVSCVDCSVVFRGDEFKAHTSCISEAEKYQGALYAGENEEKGKKRAADAADAAQEPKKAKKVTLAERVREAFKAELAKADGEVVSLRKVRKAVAKRVAKEDAAAEKDAIKAEILVSLTKLPIGVRLL